MMSLMVVLRERKQADEGGAEDDRDGANECHFFLL